MLMLTFVSFLFFLGSRSSISKLFNFENFFFFLIFDKMLILIFFFFVVFCFFSILDFGFGFFFFYYNFDEMLMLTFVSFLFFLGSRSSISKVFNFENFFFYLNFDKTLILTFVSFVGFWFVSTLDFGFGIFFGGLSWVYNLLCCYRLVVVFKSLFVMSV